MLGTNDKRACVMYLSLAATLRGGDGINIAYYIDISPGLCVSQRSISE